MSFFKSIEQHLDGINLNIVIMKTENGLTVSVLPQAKVKDEAMKNLKPILLKGTSDELDAQFAGIIQEPLQKVSGITSNIIEFEKATESAKAKTEMTKAKKEATKKLHEKADKFLTEADEMIKAKDIPGAVLKIKGALKIAPDYKKAKDLLKKHDTGSVGMFEETAKVVEVAPVVTETVVVNNDKGQVGTIQQEVAPEIVVPKVEETPVVAEVVAPTTPPETPVIPIAKQEKVLANLAEEEALAKDFVEQGAKVMTEGTPTSMKEVAMEEQQVAEQPITIAEVVEASPQVEVVTLPKQPVTVGGVLQRLDFEKQEDYDARLKAHNDAQPKAENPAATQPSATPVVAPTSELEDMTILETAGREAAFEAEKTEVKVETPPSSASDNIEILG